MDKWELIADAHSQYHHNVLESKLTIDQCDQLFADELRRIAEEEEEEPIKPPCTCNVDAAVREEREACAKVALEHACVDFCMASNCKTARDIAEAIRARGASR